MALLLELEHIDWGATLTVVGFVIAGIWVIIRMFFAIKALKKDVQDLRNERHNEFLEMKKEIQKNFDEVNKDVKEHSVQNDKRFNNINASLMEINKNLGELSGYVRLLVDNKIKNN